MALNNSATAIRGNFIDIARPIGAPKEIEANLRYLQDGLMIVEDGRIGWLGPWHEGRRRLPGDLPVADYSGKFIVPGFIDTHIHYPQAEMIAAYGEQLLEWLNTHTFPTERRYGDLAYARRMAKFFVGELLKNGTTTALVFCTVHPESVDALFESAQAINMRLIAGKVMMDRNAPADLLDTPERGYRESRALIERWHGRGRLLYAVTPRFAPTSTPEQLNAARRLKDEFPDTYLHTHLCENRDEIAWVKALFPDCEGYLDVYHRHGLTGKKSVFAHCIHMEDEEWARLGETDSAIAFCPTSNLYLGSGLFKLHEAWRRHIRVGMGSDIGAGTSFNMLQTLSEAYKVMQMQGRKLPASEAFYLATLGGAAALGLEDKIGNFEPGKEADFIVLDPAPTALQALRQENSAELADKLFVMFTLGDDRNVECTYVDGRLVYSKSER